MLIGNGISLWKGTDGFTCRKNNGLSMIDCILLLENIMHSIQSFTFGKWSPKSEHRTLCIDIAWGR